jgi:hypothetical protein
MKVWFTNKKTGKTKKIPLAKSNYKKIKKIVLDANLKRNSIFENYSFAFSTESEDESYSIFQAFSQIPSTSLVTKSSIWIGETAAFILINFPIDILDV